MSVTGQNVGWTRKHRSGRLFLALWNMQSRSSSSEDNYANWGGELHYSYSVDGNSYSNSYYLRAAGEEDARNQVERWRNGNVVHYFAGNPARSVLILEEQTQYTPDTNE